jgi:hypothetical protein
MTEILKEEVKQWCLDLILKSNLDDWKERRYVVIGGYSYEIPFTVISYIEKNVFIYIPPLDDEFFINIYKNNVKDSLNIYNNKNVELKFKIDAPYKMFNKEKRKKHFLIKNKINNIKLDIEKRKDYYKSKKIESLLPNSKVRKMKLKKIK